MVTVVPYPPGLWCAALSYPAADVTEAIDAER